MFKCVLFWCGAGSIILVVCVVYQKGQLQKEYSVKMNMEVDKALSNYYLNNTGVEDDIIDEDEL